MHLPLENYFVVVGRAPTRSAAAVSPAVTATEAICLAVMTNLGGHGDVAGRARRLRPCAAGRSRWRSVREGGSPQVSERRRDGKEGVDGEED
jgi:hypothetical protein